MRIALPLLCLMFTTPAWAGDCPALNASFRIAGESHELRLVKGKEPNAWSDLEVHIVTGLRTHRFSLTASNGYSRQYIVPLDQTETQEGEDGSSNIIFLDENLKATDLPQANGRAPRFVLLPDFGVSLYYSTPDRAKEFIPTELWRLQEC